MHSYPIISVDTEFPGVIFHPDKHYSALTVSERYSVMKLNVDTLNLIQLGFTLSDPFGNLPDLGSGGRLLFAWEFNFNDFNLNSDLHSPDSINLLRSSGIDFERNRLEGIDSHWFACLLVNYGIVGVHFNVNWVTFHGAYDFAYLVKILTGGSSLPESMETFFELVRVFFGDDWWDKTNPVVAEIFSLMSRDEGRDTGVEVIGQIEELLSEVRVIEFKGNHIRLLLKTPIPSMDILPLQYNSASFIEPAVVDHELMIEVLENNLEPMNLEIFPADVYVDEIIRNAKSSRLDVILGKKKIRMTRRSRSFMLLGGKTKGAFSEALAKKLLKLLSIVKYCDTLYGGLETVAAALKVQRLAGKRHQAGSDSLLTCQTFLKMMKTFFPKESGKKHAGVLFGLEMQA
ncbi:hypothetical protein J5N97_020952 [Dioscorea zingiberensis]|uniref:poly(A)-specific ribonuclease n=1 Tax=Dioscorea zingiberensis TaxID=325984 RepID=A0A9D5HE83_9LILI|nr:hypothetical protein J5N97_020952 [Dioscorea zingiberensis]